MVQLALKPSRNFWELIATMFVYRGHKFHDRLFNVRRGSEAASAHKPAVTSIRTPFEGANTVAGHTAPIRKRDTTFIWKGIDWIIRRGHSELDVIVRYSLTDATVWIGPIGMQYVLRAMSFQSSNRLVFRPTTCFCLVRESVPELLKIGW